MEKSKKLHIETPAGKGLSRGENLVAIVIDQVKK